ncbi:secretion protein HylD (plasmid) [Azospirillum thermophilum]|uniref:Secretion protein HylD n=2 Tax=Azospirillum thermophilum TaxID=2202148 RepID=A0A2S2CZ82_9PROT|nr:secretion protein HylD [Azospirillum thermophilum]
MDAHVLASLLHLGRRARQAQDQAELRFVLVNETHGLAPYRQAALWIKGGGIAALSGVVSVEANAPYVQWLGGVCRHLEETGSAAAPRLLQADDLRQRDVAEWGDWLPSEALWLPLPAVGPSFPGGALLLARDDPWTGPEAALLAEWAEMWAAAYALRQGSRLGRLKALLGGGGRRRLSPPLLVLAALAVLAVVPVRLTVLAPAEIVPLDPFIVRSPLDGVIDHLTVVPNQRVRADEPLFEFDRTTIGNKLLVAEKTLETVRAEYRQRAQQALFDEASKAQLAVLRGQVAEKELEVEYLRKLDGRSIMAAPRDGVVLFDDPAEWIGRPVVTGERVMVVAVEGEVEVEAWLSPANAVDLEQGAPVTVYLNADPLSPVSAHLRSVAHEAARRPDGTYAYRVRATLAQAQAAARTGLKGTAKLEGEKVPLVYWVLRRPLADARAWLGV